MWYSGDRNELSSGDRFRRDPPGGVSEASGSSLGQYIHDCPVLAARGDL